MPFDPLRRHDLDNMWGQDREKMGAGEHRTGLPGLTTEDIAILESQGAIADRTKERRAKGDIMVVALRRMLVERAKAFARGERTTIPMSIMETSGRPWALSWKVRAGATCPVSLGRRWAPKGKSRSKLRNRRMEGRGRKGDATREALMNAGFKVFAEKGFLRTQIGDIVREAGKSNGVFHIYFKSKDALLDAWLYRCDEMAPWYQADTSLLFEKARLFTIQSYWSLYEKFGPALDALNAAALVSDHFHQRLSALRRKGDDSIAKMIRNAQSEGRFCGIDPELTSISIAAITSGSTAYWFSHRAELEARGIDSVATIAHLDKLYLLMLGGVASQIDDEEIESTGAGARRGSS